MSSGIDDGDSLALPSTIHDQSQLDDLLSRPTAGVVSTLARLGGDLVVLGVAGKMGPTLARMARRASDMSGTKRRIIGVARFSKPNDQAKLESWGIDTIRCDLLDEAALAGLPEAANVVYMAGMKFGAAGNEAMTWAMNTLLPALVCKRYASSRIVAFSTGNIFGLRPLTSGGATEMDSPCPVGDYAMSCLGRERLFEHFSKTAGTKVAFARVYYACELRYGVLVDLAQQVWSGHPIDVTMGNFMTMWQGDANAMCLRAFDHADSPPFALNIAGPELMSVRRVCTDLAGLMKRPVEFVGQESADALIGNGQRAHRLFGYPQVPVQRLMEWIADWVMRGGASLGKPTHFEARDGKY